MNDQKYYEEMYIEYKKYPEFYKAIIDYCLIF